MEEEFPDAVYSRYRSSQTVPFKIVRVCKSYPQINQENFENIGKIKKYHTRLTLTLSNCKIVGHLMLL